MIAEQGWPDDLTDLPGVGPYTAAAIRNQAFGEPVLPVDTNVARIQERTGHSFGPDALQALFDLGATVCLARVPRCEACPLAGGCPSRGRRYEPLRKQSRFEGSFRQRRALLLREVAAEPRPLETLDREAVDSLAAGRPRRAVGRARAPAGLDRVVHPDVGLDVDALVALAVDLDRDERARDDVGAALREDAASSSPPTRATVPEIRIDSGATRISFAPASSCTRSHGSSSLPSSRRHSM